MMKLKVFSRNLGLSHKIAPCWNLKRTSIYFSVLILSTLLGFGCSPQKNTPKPLTELQKKFEKKCLDEYKLQVITRINNKTMWIYLPTDKPLFDFSAEKPTPEDPEKKSSKYNLLYLNGSFKNENFDFEYDIVPKNKSDAQSYGIRNEGTEHFNKIYKNLFSAITEILLDPQIPLSFIVMAITDIKKGMEIRYTFYLEDYRKASVEGLPYDEFTKRILQDSKGNTEFIGDEIGQHLEFSDIAMSDFLTKQMINRIRFKFTQSDFPPQEKYEETIFGIIADTVRYYDFKDFKALMTSDLRTKKSSTLSPQELSVFGDKKPKEEPKGKYIHIIFDKGQTHFDEKSIEELKADKKNSAETTETKNQTL